MDVVFIALGVAVLAVFGLYAVFLRSV